MKIKKIVINELPIGKARPRVTRYVTFDPQKEKANWNKAIIKEQVDEIIESPIELEMKFYMRIPKATSKVKITKMLSNEIKHTKKLDLDNMIKFYNDVMNCLVYKDDSQIYKLTASKQYDLNPRTEITIMW